MIKGTRLKKKYDTTELIENWRTDVTRLRAAISAALTRLHVRNPIAVELRSALEDIKSSR